MSLQAALIRPPLSLPPRRLVKQRRGSSVPLWVDTQYYSKGFDARSMRQNLPGYYHHMRQSGNRTINPVSLIAPTFTKFNEWAIANAAVEYNLSTAETHDHAQRAMLGGPLRIPYLSNPVQDRFDLYLQAKAVGLWQQEIPSLDEAILILEKVSDMSRSNGEFRMSEDAILQLSITVSNMIKETAELTIWDSSYLCRVLNVVYHAQHGWTADEHVIYFLENLRDGERRALHDYMVIHLVPTGDIFATHASQYIWNVIGI